MESFCLLSQTIKIRILRCEKFYPNGSLGGFPPYKEETITITANPIAQNICCAIKMPISILHPKSGENIVKKAAIK